MWNKQHISGIAFVVLLVVVDIVVCSDWMFLFSEKERLQCNVFEACGCLWAYLADLRSSEGGSHVHYNPFYEPLKHNGPLLPPAAALAPTLWPQFHLRWACPEEAKAGEIEEQCRKINMKYSEMQKVVIFLHFLIITIFHLQLLPSPIVDGNYSFLTHHVSMSLILVATSCCFL